MNASYKLEYNKQTNPHSSTTQANGRSSPPSVPICRFSLCDRLRNAQRSDTCHTRAAASPSNVICVRAAHPPFAGAHPGVASHASPRFSSYRLPVPRLSLFLHPLPPSIPRQVSTAIKPPRALNRQNAKQRQGTLDQLLPSACLDRIAAIICCCVESALRILLHGIAPYCHGSRVLSA